MSEHTVPAPLDGARVDRAVASLWSLPVNAARRLCEEQRVRLGARRARAGDRVRVGEVIALVDVDEDGGVAAWFVPAPPVPVLYEDAAVVVVDKPVGMACHPLVPREGGTVVDAVVTAFPEVAAAGPDGREGGLLHRLDNGTSGCLAFARTQASWRSLSALLRDDDDTTGGAGGGVEKTYLALVRGSVTASFVVDDAIGHDPRDRRRMRVDPAGRAARTDVTPRGAHGGLSVVELALRGGRRHQLRVHLAAAGHPLVGDALYGDVDARPFLLHAWRLGLPERPVVTAPLPAVFLAALQAARIAMTA